MKPESQTLHRTVIYRAHGASESGACAYAVVKWSPELVALVNARRDLWQMVRSRESELAHLEFWDGHVTWYGTSIWDGITLDPDPAGIDEIDLEALLDDEGMAHFDDHNWAPMMQPIDPVVQAARTENDWMVIAEHGIWFTASPKHEDTTVETTVFSYDLIQRWLRSDD